MSDFKVIAETLGTASQQYQGLAQEAFGVGSALGGIHLSAGDFGHMPGQNSLHAGYMQHVQESKQGIAEVAQGMTKIAAGLSHTAQAYADMERNAQQAIGRYFQGVGE